MFFFLSFPDISQISILRHESDANMRRMPEFNQIEKGKIVLADGVTFSWNAATDVEVFVHENGTKVSVKEMIYVVTS